MIRLYLSGMALATAALTATLASAGDFDIARLPAEAPVASAGDPSTPQGVPPVPSSDPRRPSKSLNIDLKIDANGFRLGGRLSGSEGVSSASLGAQLRGDGVSVDGRLEGNDGPTRDFKMNLDLLPGWARTAARLWLLLP